jgi:hypothetical protein
MPKKKRVVRRQIIGVVKELKKARKSMKPADMEALRQQAHAMIDSMYCDEILFKSFELFIKAVEVMAVIGDDIEDLADLVGAKMAENIAAQVAAKEAAEKK